MDSRLREPSTRNACKQYNPRTDEIFIAHGEVLTASDNDDRDLFDPSWLGQTVNDHQWGYCIRCGQPFQWRPDLFQWVDVTHEQVHEAYMESVAWIREKAMSYLDPGDRDGANL